jgi:site-specific DNA-methyltransferase (adenine-specific)
MGYPYRSSYEMIAYGQKGNRGVPQDRNVRDVLRFPKVKHKDAYPTEKPVELLQVMINQSTSPGDIVLDPFAGSGSTLMAAQRLGRKSLGFDISRDAIDHYHRSNAIFQLSVPWII